MRKCPCGEEISPTRKTLEFGVQHGRDLTKWPAKCNRCLVDQAIGMFEALETAGLPAALSFDTPKNICADCTKAIDVKVDHYFAGVPGVGDLCPKCHELRFKEET